MFEQISWWCKPGEIVIASDAAIECDSDFCNKLERGRSDHLRCARDRCTRFCPICEHPQITSLQKISIGVAGSPSHPMPLRRPPNRVAVSVLVTFDPQASPPHMHLLNRRTPRIKRGSPNAIAAQAQIMPTSGLALSPASY